jgi:hypothetical protein
MMVCDMSFREAQVCWHPRGHASSQIDVCTQGVLVELDWQTLSITLIAVCGLSWVVLCVYRCKAIDHDFNCIITGGRFGNIQIDLRGRTVIAEYDVGTEVDFLINVSSVVWVGNKALSTEECLEVIDQLKRWASSRGSSIEFVDDASRI